MDNKNDAKPELSAPTDDTRKTESHLEQAVSGFLETRGTIGEQLDSKDETGQLENDPEIREARELQERTYNELRPNLGRVEVEATGRIGWKAKDGTIFHKLAEDHAVATLDNPDLGISVEKEVDARVLNKEGDLVKTGRMDLVINERDIIEFKTDDMSEWGDKESIARSRGDKYGRQVAEYVASPDTSADARGHIFMLGRKPAENLQRAFRDAAAQHNVSVTYLDAALDSAEPSPITAVIQDRFLQPE